MKQPLIEVRGLVKSFDDVQVLRGLDLDVFEGETFVLLGGSGSGKTVLMKHLEGLLQPDAGTVRIAGHDVSSGQRRELDAVHHVIGVAFQAGALFDSLSVFDNVAFPLREQLHLKKAEVEARVQRMLALVGLGDSVTKLPGELSGGMRKRVAFARALGDEIPAAADCFRYFAGAVRCMGGPLAGEYLAGHTSMIRRDAVGVVASIAPWNYPLAMAVWFAPLAVTLDGLRAPGALAASLRAILRNGLPFVLYSAVLGGVGAVTFVALSVTGMAPPVAMEAAFWILMPLLVASVYVSYRDIFGAAEQA